MAYRLVALDPGGHTGWATFTVPGSLVALEGTEFDAGLFVCGTFEPDGDSAKGGFSIGHHQQLYDALGMWHTETYSVISESFEYRNNSPAGLELISREYIGIARLFCRQRNVGFYTQTASEGKVDRKGKRGLVKPANLQRLGLWYSQHADRHAMDAYGHLLYFMIKHHIYDKQILEKGWK